nr:flagellar FlbD family protein [Enterococcus cecorum]
MIELTSFNGKIFYLNPDLIYRMDEVPDTTITLVDGKSLIVRESAIDVVNLIISYRQQTLSQVANVLKLESEEG